MRAMRVLPALVVACLVGVTANVRAQVPDKEPPGGGPMKIDAAPPSDNFIGKYQLGARVRGIFATHAMLSPYLAANTGTSMESYAVGLEFIYRKPKYDIVTSLDFSFLDVHDGNFLGAGHDASLDTHYVQFRNLGFLSADVSLIGHHKFLPWLELRYGGGLGLGWVAGDVLLTNNGPQCNAANAKDPSQCFPLNTGPINGRPTTAQEASLKASEGTGTDTAQNPHRHVSGDKPPVMAVLNLLVGIRFYPIPRLALTYEIGFRNAIFTGIGVHYLF
jgi:hypothetical protein